MRHFKALKGINLQAKVAWHVQGDDEQQAVIVFCNYGYVARQMGAKKLSLPKAELSVQRMPQYDEFASAGIIPTSMLLEGV
ncbi:hypothetical protein ACEUAI_13155 [Aeromonas veronii]